MVRLDTGNALNAVRTAFKWQARPSPNPQAAAAGTGVTGRGVAVMQRTDTYWACACQVSVNRATGKVTVDNVMFDNRARGLVTITAKLVDAHGNRVLDVVTDAYLHCRSTRGQ